MCGAVDSYHGIEPTQPVEHAATIEARAGRQQLLSESRTVSGVGFARSLIDSGCVGGSGFHAFENNVRYFKSLCAFQFN
jgi:hypothetical protein